MASSSSTSMLSPCERLPDEVLLRVLEHVMMDESPGWKNGLRAVRGVSRRWRAVHDAACTQLWVYDGVTDEAMHVLCGRLPALGCLCMYKVKSLTVEGLRELRGLPALTHLGLNGCSKITHAGLRELRELTALTFINLDRCSIGTDLGLQQLARLTKLDGLSICDCKGVTDVGLRHLSSLPALTKLCLGGTSTTQAGRDTLKAALPALTIIG